MADHPTLCSAWTFVDQLMDNMPVAVILYDRDLHLTVKANRKFLELFGLQRPKADFDFFKTVVDKATRDSVLGMIRDGYSAILELRLKARGGALLALTHIAYIEAFGARIAQLSFTSVQAVEAPPDTHPATDLAARGLYTPKELELMRLLARGSPNREISLALNIGDGTTRNYISTILGKLGVKNRTQAALVIKRLNLDC